MDIIKTKIVNMNLLLLKSIFLKFIIVFLLGLKYNLKKKTLKVVVLVFSFQSKVKGKIQLDPPFLIPMP